MTSRNDVENRPAPDERAPLLAHEAGRDHSRAPSENSHVSSEPPKATSRTWRYCWRAFWIVFVVLIIAVFVKGWISADDVDVSSRDCDRIVGQNLTQQRGDSLISKVP